MFRNGSSTQRLEIGTRVRIRRGPLRDSVGTVAEIITDESDPSEWYSLIDDEGQRLWYYDANNEGTGIFLASELEKI